MFFENVVSFLLRLIALVASVAATILMVTSHDSTTVLNITFEAKFTNSPTFKYFVIINSLASVYSLIALFLRFKISLRRVLIASDLVIMALLNSSISAAVAIGFVGKEGNAHAGWLPVCSQVPNFCNHITASLISGFIAAVFYFLLIVFSLHNVINLFSLKG